MTADPPPSTTAPYYSDADVTLHLGDSLDVLPTLADASVDAVVCDPPYGLTELSTTLVLQAIAAWMAGDRTHVPDGRGFMGREWDKFVPPPGVWDECLRVLKPGGHLLAFAGARTVDLMGLSIRIAGFEIRDSIDWIYGSGFPKSHDVSKAIDKAGGSSPVEQAAVLRIARERAGLTRDQVATAVGCTAGSIRDWEDGRARAKGRAVEHIVPSPQYRDALADLLGYTQDERVVVGVGGGSRSLYETGHRGVQYGESVTALARHWDGWGTALKPAHEPIVLARKPLAGTVAANVLRHGTGALNVDATRTTAGQDYRDKCASVVGIGSPRNGDTLSEWTGVREDSAHDLGRWPTNVLLAHPPLLDDHGQPIGDACADGCVSGCPVADMDRQSGVHASGGRTYSVGQQTAQAWRAAEGRTDIPTRASDYSRSPDSGGASRFFPVFRYEAKAPASERPRLADGTAHTTVKPLDLMQWLVRLVTPPGGMVLDPFAGSGTTLEACVIEGFRAVGIEREEPHAQLCVARLSKPITPSLFGLGEAS